MKKNADNPSSKNLRTGMRGSLILAVVVAGVMAVGAVVDFQWTAWFGQHQWPTMARIMGRTIFEGEPPGINDPVIFMLILAALVHYVGWRRPGVIGLARWRPETGFILAAALISAVLFVHGLKWTVGRARPDLVIRHGFPYSHWFSFGPHFITDGIFRGAFPSGHTSQTFTLMAAAYALAGSPAADQKRRFIGILVGVAVLGGSLTMGAARCMSLSHWVTDVLGSVGIGWLLIHICYFHLFRVPEQVRFIRTYDRQPGLPDVWELRICALLTMATLGAMAIVLGTRGLFLGHGIGFAAGVPIGGILLWWATSRVQAMHRLVGLILDAPTSQPPAST